MRFATFFFLGALLSGGSQIDAQTIIQMGLPFAKDVVHDLTYTSDGSFITTTTRVTTGVLYKSDCSGNVIKEFPKSTFPYPLHLFDAVELSDGDIVVAGYMEQVISPADTLDQLVLLKVDSDLNEKAFVKYPLMGVDTRAKSLTLSPDGTLLVFGDIRGQGVNFWDYFFARVDTVSLMPLSNPVVYDYGVDEARQIKPAGDGTYLLSGHSLIGFLFDPESVVTNRLVVMRVDEQGQLIWQYRFQQEYKVKYGFCRMGGVDIHPATGNLLCAGTMYVGAADSLPDPVLLLLDSQGNALDTLYEPIPGAQTLYNNVANPGDAGAFLTAGETAHPGSWPTLLLLNPKEFNNQIIYNGYVNDTTTPVSLRLIVEIPVNRFALAGTTPDNPASPNLTDILLATPSIDNIEILYQNCALSASLNAPSPTYQWYLDGAPIPFANSGVLFPAAPGIYAVQVIDAVGCIGASDTISVVFTTADFDFVADNGTYTFTNASVAADTYLWDFGDGATSTQVNPVHVYSQSGNYPVTLIAQGPCGSDTLVYMLTGTDDHAGIRHIRLFPNPGDGYFTLTLEGTPQDMLALDFLDMTGKTLESRELDFRSGKTAQEFRFASLPAGVYTLQVRGGGSVHYEKVIVR
ncbi:MAG: PKD domain-containing protein [Saprospiraceae bacterium]|nr:PKD domain-containing protein [Saprospiraceae bacterium]MCB0542343.1 PKD domain-containing protein [Saprospiraceae bacterium]MCB0572947.1 PKD domain-containing protein [Saprospiraceae bacterium]MCB9353276.1 PKD domain-containing protein [Lewinellaceae bacterium]